MTMQRLPPSPPRRRILTGRKILLASVGLATISYVGCNNSLTTSGNLMAIPRDSAADAQDAEPPPTSGNLMPTPYDAGPDTSLPDATPDAPADMDTGSDAADAKADG